MVGCVIEYDMFTLLTISFLLVVCEGILGGVFRNVSSTKI